MHHLTGRRLLGDDEALVDYLGDLVGDPRREPGLSEQFLRPGRGLPDQGGHGGVPGPGGDQQAHGGAGFHLVVRWGVGAGHQSEGDRRVGHLLIVAHQEAQVGQGGGRALPGLAAQIGDGHQTLGVAGHQQPQEQHQPQSEQGQRGEDADDQGAAVRAPRFRVGPALLGLPGSRRGQRGSTDRSGQAGGGVVVGRGGGRLPGQEPAQVEGEGAGRLVAPARVLLQAAHDDGVEGLGDVGVQVGGRGRELPDVLVGHRHRTLPHEGRHARE